MMQASSYHGEQPHDYMYLNSMDPGSASGQLLAPSVFHSDHEHGLPAFSTPTGPELEHEDPALQQMPNGQAQQLLAGDIDLPTQQQGQKRGGKRQKLSQYRGVSKNKDKWVAQIGREKRLCYLGLFETEEEAARAFDVAALRLRGEQAETNFPASDYSEELQSLNEAAGATHALPVRRRRNKASQFRGVCLASGKYISQITVDGKHHYLGVFPTEEDAARAYDRKAIELRGNSAATNFPIEDYMEGGAAANLGEAEPSQGGQAVGQRGSSSRFRGVTGSQGKWIAQLVADKKYNYLGTFSTEEEAAQAYDKAALVLLGPSAQTNFPATNYETAVAEANALTANGGDPSSVFQLGRKRAKTSKYRGVCKSKDKWIAQIKCGPNHLYLGCFDTEEAAARAYDRQAISHRGERASTNYPIAEYRNDPLVKFPAPAGGQCKGADLRTVPVTA
ncbi:hypothetical protein WJX72_002140 [[Myrmecia] bisecta]|uniref:AP2/ERF domain-containing protein n=1 Tax=[Myrmecia] bisecta TaxID=41462 RepID=A0AAW1QEI2_9CHLO